MHSPFLINTPRWSNVVRNFDPYHGRILVPKGHLKIAQRFSVGYAAPRFLSPEGTAEKAPILRALSRPFGTFSLWPVNPTLKRWAILGMSLRDKNSSEFPSCIAMQPRSNCSTGNWQLAIGNFIPHSLADSLTRSLTCFLAALCLLTGCEKKTEAPAEGQKGEANKSEPESRVKHGTNGEVIITLDAPTQKLMGLETAPLAAATLPPELRAY